MRVYHDEDIASQELANRLSARHQLVATIRGASDRRAWEHAQSHDATVITMNSDDFILLAPEATGHHGLLLVYREREDRRSISAAEISVAVDRVEAEGGFEDRVINLNHFRS